MRPVATALAAASLVFTLASTAHAAPPDDVELGLTTGLITKPSGNAGSPVALGLGARVGGMISGFYFGLNVINYWGGSAARIHAARRFMARARIYPPEAR